MGSSTASTDVDKIFLENQEREQALRNLLKTRPSESRDVSQPAPYRICFNAVSRVLLYAAACTFVCVFFWCGTISFLLVIRDI